MSQFKIISKAALAASFVFITSACASSDGETESPIPGQVALNTLWLSSQCNLLPAAVKALEPEQNLNAAAVERVIVVRDAAKWQLFWKSVHSSQFEAPPAPEVDFDKHSLIAVIAAPQSRSGGGIELAGNAARADDLLQVPVTIRDPAPGTMSAAVVTQPCVVVQTYPALEDDLKVTAGASSTN
ncbi:protease complex subunit PrcB family protein [Allohahella marinimesophila]|uniref:Lipoprotein n=1 Tax=Allohahella marinimesophila TaxID=1054972 RepID=A0ABP7NHG0_9GAMM